MIRNLSKDVAGYDGTADRDRGRNAKKRVSTANEVGAPLRWLSVAFTGAFIQWAGNYSAYEPIRPSLAKNPVAIC